MKVDVLNGKWSIKCSYMENHRVQELPKKEFKKKFSLWAVAPIYDNAVSLMASFYDDMTPEAIALANEIIASIVPATIEGEPPAIALNGLLDHQVTAIKQAWNHEGYAILHRPRLRKTSTTIRLACGRFIAGQIDSLLVIAPNSIKSVWEMEWPKRAVCPYNIHVLNTKKDVGKKKINAWLAAIKESKNSAKNSAKLHVLVVSVEGQASVGGQDLAREFVEIYGDRTMIAIDESTRIKNHQSLRTEAIWALGEIAGFRNILTGSEVTRSPGDLFAQFRFLGTHTLGFDSYYAFKGRYIVMGGFERKKEVGVKNVDELMAKLTAYAHLVKTSDVVKLPEKTFTQRIIDPTAEQIKMVKELQKTLETSMETAEGDHETIVQTAMTLLLRAQQIAGGFFPSLQDDGTSIPIPLKTNPKLNELMEVLAEEQGKVIIWARFVAEIEAITDAIVREYGEGSVVQFYGKQNEDERTRSRVSFQADEHVRYFVGNPTCGSMGLELSAANVMCYYSMDYQYESRVQSLERATNLEKTEGIGVVDFTLDLNADRSIMEATNQKKDISEWIEDAVHSGKFSLI
jgi:SNF2 family DNA or RNA helicase